MSRGLDPSRDADAPGIVVYTLFAARDDIVLQESHPVPAGFESLLGVAVPSLFVCRKSALEEGGGVCFGVTMRASSAWSAPTPRHARASRFQL